MLREKIEGEFKNREQVRIDSPDGETLYLRITDIRQQLTQKGRPQNVVELEFGLPRGYTITSLGIPIGIDEPPIYPDDDETD